MPAERAIKAIMREYHVPRKEAERIYYGHEYNLKADARVGRLKRSTLARKRSSVGKKRS